MRISARIEEWPLRRPFRISGQTFTLCSALVVEIEADGCVGRGEAAGVGYRGETPAGLLEQAKAFAASFPSDLTRASLQTLLPSGGARNAIDCALWEFDARRAKTSVWRLAGLQQMRPLVTTFTIGADAPEDMARQAIAFAEAQALKLKLSGDPGIDIERIRLVRRARPDAWLGVDANRGYTPEAFALIAPTLIEAEVRQVEQPFAVGREQEMSAIAGPFDRVADESAQSSADLDALVGWFDAVSIKLDKAGGLTEALAMAKRARSLGLKVMVGNMVGTSWSQAAGFVVGQSCDIVDLDGATFLTADRRPAVSYRDGSIWCGDDVWGA